MEQKNGILSGALIICRAKNGILQGHKVCMGLRDHILYVARNRIMQEHKVCMDVRDPICSKEWDSAGAL